MTQGVALQVRRLRYGFPGQAHDLLTVPKLDLPAGQSLGVSGVSGAGKTTLFHCLAGIAKPLAGQVLWGDTDICTLSSEALAAWRRQHLGLVFQDFHLVDGLTALDNVLLPAYFGRWSIPSGVRARAHELLSAVDMNAPDRLAAVLSRGERQRVAFARALLLQPTIVMADEPTASLDPEQRAQLGGLLVALARAHGTTLVVISHEPELLARMDSCLVLQKGQLNARGINEMAT
ncbi:ABC transporter ATP-binding protein [Rhodoferax sp. U11-2br]|uniref:ABC transporter ATP-binding protein n=1 Tax=Rhodoferax sp. U11-2br TaxID=2838878 RepID=UPI001BE60CEF|nr:ATP-binding cassette domain-containing protein [Rhodoferax sp. U11-2br]MBT3067804.1 ATP-binding cassette domain-containing protein [Rhodoferax sp. U11-2br]